MIISWGSCLVGVVSIESQLEADSLENLYDAHSLESPVAKQHVYVWVAGMANHGRFSQEMGPYCFA